MRRVLPPADPSIQKGLIMATQQYDFVAASAAAFAIRAHDGQYRTGTRFPYAVHPIGVAALLRDHYPDDEDLEAAGYLHDVLEDTVTTRPFLTSRFGIVIADLVYSVTRRPGWQLSDFEDPRVLRLKAADTIDNVRDTIRGFEKGHDVWSRFSAGREKLHQWETNAHIIEIGLPGEPIAKTLVEAVERVATF